MNLREKLQLMHERFGKDPDHICRDCMHRMIKSMSRDYAKCEVFGISGGPGTDWGSLQTACGLYNKKTDLRDLFLPTRGGSRKKNTELQPETLFDQEETEA